MNGGACGSPHLSQRSRIVRFAVERAMSWRCRSCTRELTTDREG
jgi:hypothetical protein